MRSAKIQSSLLLFSAFLIAACGLVYELIAGTVSSYLLGDSVTQFSRTIGVYLFAMGVGSYLSRFILRNAIEKFIDLEIALALVGGFAAPLLFVVFSFTAHYAFVLYALLIVIGTLVGLEIPLLLRILKDRMNFRDLVARVLSLDYIGGLVAAVSFPILLLRPEVGLIRASILAGVLNVLVAFVAIYVFQTQVRLRLLLVKACAVLLVLVIGLVYSKPLQGFLDQELHNDPVVYSEQSHYQKIVMTSWHEYFSLFLNNNLQFNSFDEYRYHEALVHVPVQMVLDRRADTAQPLQVLIMGGGDGLAIREFLRYKNVARVDLVDIDPAMTKLAREHPWLKELNGNAMSDPRVHVYHEDAFIFLQAEGTDAQGRARDTKSLDAQAGGTDAQGRARDTKSLDAPAKGTDAQGRARDTKSLDAQARGTRLYDIVILDFPDPGNFAIGKLYSDMFFHRLKRVMAPGAVAVTQSTSPFVARTAFWCIHNTVESQGYKTLPYHAYVPSFGEWGFVAFSREPLRMPLKLQLAEQMRFLTKEVLQSMAFFPADMARVPTEIQTLMTQNLVHYYEREWHRATR